MSKKASSSEISYAVKHVQSGMFLDDERKLAKLDRAELFTTQKNAENFRDYVAYKFAYDDDLVVVTIRESLEEI